jgi:hypothetical protein
MSRKDFEPNSVVDEKQLVWRVGTDSVAGDPDKNRKKLVKRLRRCSRISFVKRVGVSLRELKAVEG